LIRTNPAVVYAVDDLLMRVRLRIFTGCGFVIAHLIHQPEPDRRVVVPYHSGSDLPRGTLGAIIEQAGLSINEFIELL
jgi:hypothetical protein